MKNLFTQPSTWAGLILLGLGAVLIMEHKITEGVSLCTIGGGLIGYQEKDK